MSVIDFHSHVLPRIDDGSHSSEESLGMLQISASQGIDVMAATSHFYATEDRISSFLNRRRWSEERLKERMNQELTKEERIPRLIMGAEVAFFTGISRAERLEELTYEGTDLLLLEMPFTKWNKSEIEEVRYISERRKLRVMLAHLERFLMIPGNKKRIYELMELPVYVQINAGIFDGDMVIVEQQPTADNGDIVVAMIEDSATVKRFYKEDGYYRLQPENDTMDPIIVSEVSIIGKVVGLYRSMK